MIFLFCNDGYGAPFQRATTQAAAELGFDLVVVRSARPSRSAQPSRLQRARWNAAAAWATVRSSDHVAFSTDVNGARFSRRIDPEDHGVVAGFNQIFRPPLIERFATLVNFHPSILPWYRGPVPSHWCLVNGEHATGYSLHDIAPRIDAGRILDQAIVPIDAGTDEASLDRRIAEAAIPALRRWLEHVTVGRPFEGHLVPETVYRNPVEYASFPTPEGEHP